MLKEQTCLCLQNTKISGNEAKTCETNKTGWAPRTIIQFQINPDTIVM